jgi:hypothetical protein
MIQATGDTLTEQKKTTEGEFVVRGMFLGTCLGIFFGAVVGAVTGRVGLWLPVGLSVGIGVGLGVGGFIEMNKKRKDKPN